MASPQNDTLTLQFFSNGNLLEAVTLFFEGDQSALLGNSIGNVTQVNIEKDFFVPSNGLTIVIEDADVIELSKFIQRGFKIKAFINDKLNMVGYIFDINLEYSRSGGTKMTIVAKDLLEYMAQGTVYPNMGILGSAGVTNFHFKSTDSLKYALQTIANAFAFATDSGHIDIKTDKSGDLKFSSGFASGLRMRGKTPKTRQSSLTHDLNHLTTPMKGESYLAYMLRLTKHAGGNLKMFDTQDNVIYCQAPMYYPENPTPFELNHYLDPAQNSKNNILSAHYRYDFEKQPSVVIVEANTTGDGKFYQSTLKGIAINELTGYSLVPNRNGGGQAPILSVVKAIDALTNGNVGTGYVLADFNNDLYNARGNLALDIETNVSIPYYTVDYNAHTKEEVSFAASKILAEHQDQYVQFTYRVAGWSTSDDNGNDFVWQPDMLVWITDEVFKTPNSSSDKSRFLMWIKRVNFLRSRSGGTETEIICTLPYTHNFEVQD